MKHILVVEDDTINAVVFRRILERRGGYRVTVSDAGPEVLELVRSGGVDLVVMDVSLARTEVEGKAMSGVDLCRLFKADPRTAAIPVLLATAHAMRGDAERLIKESGADGYVAKPIVDHAGFVKIVDDLARKAA